MAFKWQDRKQPFRIPRWDCGAPALVPDGVSLLQAGIRELGDKSLLHPTVQPDLFQRTWSAAMKRTPFSSRWAERKSTVVYGTFFLVHFTTFVSISLFY